MRATHQIASKCRSVGQQQQAEQILSTGFVPSPTLVRGLEPLEFRKPLLYRPLVEFMMSIPWDQKLLPDQDRVLQRRALKGVLPERIRQRQGKGDLAGTYSEGLRNAKGWLELLLNRPRIVERGYVDHRLWSEAVTRARYGRSSSERHFLAAATLEVWLRQLEDFRQPL
jgi:asparagine synthase (glutamine-hydrolysing)